MTQNERVLDLREAGHQIGKPIIEANGTATYRLGVERDADGPREPVSVPLDTPLFDQPVTTGSPFGCWDA